MSAAMAIEEVAAGDGALSTWMIWSTPRKRNSSTIVPSRSTAGFALVAAVVIGRLPQAWWQPLAVVSSVASILGLLFFPAAFPVFSTVGALVIDVAVLVAVLWMHWVPSDLAA